MPMNARNFRGVEKLIRAFSLMLYIGVAVTIAAVALGLLLQGSTEAIVIGGCVACGVAMIFFGYRGRKRSMKLLSRLRDQSTEQ